MKVLWLDDTANDPEQRAFLLDEWNLKDENVLSATRLEEALRLLNAADIRLVILDLI